MGQQLQREEDGERGWRIIESGGLIIIGLVLAMRGFYLRFDYVEVLFAIGGLLVMASYVRKGWLAYVQLHKENGLIAMLVLTFFLSVVFYLLSMLTVPFAPRFAEPAGGVAFMLLILFAAASFFKRDFIIDGDKVSPFSWVAKQKGRSILLMSLFLAFSLYMGLTKVDLIPRMYSDQFPQAYFELVNRAESGEERPVDGAYQHEKFKAAYDRFVRRRGLEE
jgi:hypothetical protein